MDSFREDVHVCCGLEGMLADEVFGDDSEDRRGDFRRRL